MASIVSSQSLAAAATLTSSSFPFTMGNVLTATCVIGATPPNQQCLVTLQLSLDNVNWTSVDTRIFGVEPSQSYYHTFTFSDYTGAGSYTNPRWLQLLNNANAAEWAYYRLVFAGNDSQAVTIGATDANTADIIELTLTGTTSTSGGGIAAWTPPEGGPMIITNLAVLGTANSTGAANLSVGVAANAATSATNLINAQAIGSAANTAIFSGTGTSATVGCVLTGSQAVTFTGSANSSGFAGKAFIFYAKP